MPVAKGTPLDPTRTRAAILAAATEIFYERGLDGAGIAALCAAIGASKETLYRHFGSKGGLIQAVLEARSERVTRWLTDAAQSAGDDPADQLAAIFDALGDWYAKPGFRGCAILNAATQQHDPPINALAARHLDGYRELLTGIAAQAGVDDPAQLAWQWLMLLEGATLLADHQGLGSTAAQHAKRAALALLPSSSGRAAR